MQDLHQRRGYRYRLMRALVGTGGLVLLALIALVMARGAWHMYGKFSQAAAAREAGEARLADLTEEQDRVRGVVNEPGTSRGVEAEVRERYGLARPGEGEIVVVRQNGEDTGAAGELGFWERLWSAFFVW